MDWLQLSVQVSGEQAGRVVEALEAIGSQATTQQNAGEDSYFDLAHPAEPKWDVQTVTGLFEDRSHQESLRTELSARCAFTQEVRFTALEDQDWEKAWLNQYQPIQITADLWVYPSWVEVDNRHHNVIKIDPGMAFGTGTHATTRLCMQAINELELADTSVLDYGCGSGILAITALKLGARSAVVVDIDPKAALVAQENALNNGVASRFAIQSPLEINGRKYDVVVANILAFALIDLAAELISYTKENSRIMLSGILDTQADDVILAYQEYFDFTRINAGSWVILTGRRHSKIT